MKYVFDSFAVLSYFNNEEGADKIDELIDKAKIRK